MKRIITTLSILLIAINLNAQAYDTIKITIDNYNPYQSVIVSYPNSIIFIDSSLTDELYLVTRYRYNLYKQTTNFISQTTIFDDFKKYAAYVEHRDSIQTDYINVIAKVNDDFRNELNVSLDENIKHLENISDSIVVTNNKIYSTIENLNTSKKEIRNEKMIIGIISTIVGFLIGFTY